jgi:hypothetical protein
MGACPVLRHLLLFWFQPEWKFRLAALDRSDPYSLYFTHSKTPSGLRPRLSCLYDRQNELVLLPEKRDAGCTSHPAYNFASIDIRADHSHHKENSFEFTTLVFGIRLSGVVHSFEYIVFIFSRDGTAASIGYTQSNYLFLIQIASLTGLLGVSFLISFIPLPSLLHIILRNQRKPHSHWFFFSHPAIGG